jgi:PKD repeat protein
MAEQEAASPSKPKSWFKALLGTLGGLVSGAVVMYLTPFVDRIVKPAKPVANFSFQADGCAVRFHNLSADGTGWWEFGDGSPLVPATPDREFIDHTYPRPGDYTAKLSLTNRIGDANERTVPVHIDAPPAPAAPKIVALEVTPVSAGSYAPATFKLVTKVENAPVTVLDLDDGRPLQIATDPAAASQELFVTFQKPGGYVVKLAAVNGAQYQQKTAIVTVMDAPADTLTAVLTVTDEATCVGSWTHESRFCANFPPDSHDATCPIQAEVRGRPNHDLADLALKTVDGHELRLGSQPTMDLDAAALGVPFARNLRLQWSADRQAIQLTGELVADPNSPSGPPRLMIPVTLTVQKKAPVTRTTPVTTTLQLPSGGASTSGTLMLPPLPKEWADCRRSFHLEVLDNGKKVYEDSQVQRSALVTLQGRKCILTTTQTNDQVRVDLLDAPAAVPGAGN